MVCDNTPSQIRYVDLEPENHNITSQANGFYQHQNCHKSLPHPDNRRQQNPVLAQIPRIFSEIPLIALILSQDLYLLKIGAIQFGCTNTQVCNNYICIIKGNKPESTLRTRWHFRAPENTVPSDCLLELVWSVLSPELCPAMVRASICVTKVIVAVPLWHCLFPCAC